MRSIFSIRNLSYFLAVVGMLWVVNRSWDYYYHNISNESYIEVKGSISSIEKDDIGYPIIVLSLNEYRHKFIVANPARKALIERGIFEKSVIGKQAKVSIKPSDGNRNLEALSQNNSLHSIVSLTVGDVSFFTLNEYTEIERTKREKLKWIVNLSLLITLMIVFYRLSSSKSNRKQR